MVHAGVAPVWSLQETLSLSQELSDKLCSYTYPAVLHHLFGDTPISWHEDLAENDRVRIIANYFTRMRYVTDEGKLILQDNNSFSKTGSKYRPWYACLSKSFKDIKILFGHWAALEGKSGFKNILLWIQVVAGDI